MLQTVGWQTANQTHNAAVNYANRNATNPTSVGSLALGFASAVGISAGIGLGLAQAIKRSALSLAAKTTVRLSQPPLATTLATTPSNHS